MLVRRRIIPPTARQGKATKSSIEYARREWNRK
jgi:hypothetical protein